MAFLDKFGIGKIVPQGDSRNTRCLLYYYSITWALFLQMKWLKTYKKFLLLCRYELDPTDLRKNDLYIRVYLIWINLIVQVSFLLELCLPRSHSLQQIILYIMISMCLRLWSLSCHSCSSTTALTRRYSSRRGSSGRTFRFVCAIWKYQISTI